MSNPNAPDYSHGLFQPFGALGLAQVESIEYLVDKRGEQVFDEIGNPIPTGAVNIKFIDKTGSRNKVPYVLPMVGNTVFMGGLPEVGAICVVAFRERAQPIIIGFLPTAFFNLVANRKTIPNLEEGELLLQGSIPDIDVDGRENFFRGASVKFDAYGRIIISGNEFEVIYGYVLSNEKTASVIAADDPLTGNKVFFRERLAGYERTVDSKGDMTESSPGDVKRLVGGDLEEECAGTWTKTFAKSGKITDRSGNQFAVDERGNLLIKAAAGNITQNAAGSLSIEIGGKVTEQVVGIKETTIGEEYNESISGDVTKTVASDIKETQTKGDWEQTTLVGKRTVKAATGITIESTLPLAPVKVGSDGADESLVLGNVLVSAFTDLIRHIFTTPPGVGLGNLGAPVPWNPAILAAVTAWSAKYLTTPTTNIISLKTFTERGP